MIRLLIVLLLGLSTASYAQQAVMLNTVASEHKLLQYLDDGEVKGPAAEIYQLLLKESSLVSHLEVLPWARAYRIAEKSANTLVFSMVRTAERENKFHWLLKVSELTRGFYYLANSSVKPIQSLANAKQKNIAVTRDSYSHHSLIELGFDEKKLYLVANEEAAFKLFINNKVELFYSDPDAIKYYVDQNYSTKQPAIIGVVFPRTKRYSYIAANINTDHQLITSLKKSANILKQTETYQRLYNQ